MPEGLPPKPRSPRKLTRRQVEDILERNVRLYKDEELFIPYLVELAVYLLEYEYDWSESGAEPPPARPAAGTKTAARERGGTLSDSGPILSSIARIFDSRGGRRCPHCASAISEEDIICPVCHNFTR